ncbi:MAG: LLM class F420-dependent oxidoreductase [Dehalococcoidia bacterium]|nr:LLM class F420-dependent oxidoreductase [Dehalococcoidia bacterium]HCV00827.1 LLM class F420-dependent oxidoreductase [Dehalococcoidia bacterium]|tara:strand:- start:3140 stop:4009 length:870 start_codon:yes stop_codon:yes gene_type:complete
MKIGLYGINLGVLADREAMLRIARTAEAANFESLWTGEHVVFVDPQVPPSPLIPDTPLIDTVTALAFVAGATERIRLASGILLLSQRNPVLLAKELAGLDVLSGGRLILGVGVGSVPGEFEAIGVPFEERGARTTEHIEVIRTLWTSEQPEFEGDFTTFSGIQSRPFPYQKPHPPITIGGYSPAARRRTIRQGDGWYGFMLDVEGAAAAIQSLEETAKEVERPANLRPLEITITPRGRLDRETVERFAEIGVHRLVPMPRGIMAPTGDPEGVRNEIHAFVERLAETLEL